MDSLQCKNLVKHYGKRRVVDEVSLRMDPGEVVGLLGANGAGKTTTFYMIVGLERPDSGSVLLGDQDLTKLPMYLRARLGIGYLPQEPSVFRKMTAAQNILAVRNCRSAATRTVKTVGRIAGGVWHRPRPQHARRRALRR